MVLAVSLNARVVVPDAVLVRTIEDESILLNLNNENYYGLDEVGTRIWTVLVASVTIEEALGTLLAEYEVDKRTLTDDVIGLVESLMAQGLVELHEPQLE
jgi:hypothetical protein